MLLRLRLALLSGLLLTMSTPAVLAQTAVAKAASGADEPKLSERVRREASSPLRVILEAARIKRAGVVPEPPPGSTVQTPASTTALPALPARPTTAATAARTLAVSSAARPVSTSAAAEPSPTPRAAAAPTGQAAAGVVAAAAPVPGPEPAAAGGSRSSAAGGSGSTTPVQGAAAVPAAALAAPVPATAAGPLPGAASPAELRRGAADAAAGGSPAAAAASPAPARAGAAPGQAAVPTAAAAVKLVNMVPPDIPANAMRRVGGFNELTVQVTIRADGSVGEASVVTPGMRAVEAHVVDALKQWRFEPVGESRTLRMQLVFNN